jgi:hypothetical protein
MNGLGTSRNANGEEQPKWYDAPRYRAEPLKNCTIQNITALISFQDRSHKLTVSPIENVFFSSANATVSVANSVQH